MFPLEIILFRKCMANEKRRPMMEYWRKQTIKKQAGKEKPAKVKGSQKGKRRNNPGISGT